jgi:hypothetical protein
MNVVAAFLATCGYRKIALLMSDHFILGQVTIERGGSSFNSGCRDSHGVFYSQEQE